VLLAADSRGGVALDDEGRPRGFVTVDAIAHALADDYPGRSHASAAEGDAKVTAADHASAAEGDAEIAGPGGDS
jgi:hypothetical protein